MTLTLEPFSFCRVLGRGQLRPADFYKIFAPCLFCETRAISCKMLLRFEIFRRARNHDKKSPKFSEILFGRIVILPKDLILYLLKVISLFRFFQILMWY